MKGARWRCQDLVPYPLAPTSLPDGEGLFVEKPLDKPFYLIHRTGGFIVTDVKTRAEM